MLIFILSFFFLPTGKPIRFDYKNWVLAADHGYPFKVVPYQGKENGAKTTGALGPKVVNSLLEVVTHPKMHDAHFDNFFSMTLLRQLREKEIKASGTKRNNRTGNCPLTPVKTIKKKERGTLEVFSSSELCAVRWVDNKAVTIVSNNCTNEPMQSIQPVCKREDKHASTRHYQKIKSAFEDVLTN